MDNLKPNNFKAASYYGCVKETFKNMISNWPINIMYCLGMLQNHNYIYKRNTTFKIARDKEGEENKDNGLV